MSPMTQPPPWKYTSTGRSPGSDVGTYTRTGMSPAGPGAVWSLTTAISAFVAVVLRRL
jgi:hypothetical protein